MAKNYNDHENGKTESVNSDGAKFSDFALICPESKINSSDIRNALQVHRDSNRTIPLFGKSFSTPDAAIQEENRRKKTQNAPFSPLVGFRLERFHYFRDALSLVFFKWIRSENINGK